MYNNNYTSPEILQTRLDTSMNNEMPYSNFSESICYEMCDTNMKDKEYISSLFPFEARIIKEIVDDELDKLEYEGSTIFHEYPDRAFLQSIIDNIENILNTDTNNSSSNQSEQTDNMTLQMQQRCSGPNCFPQPTPLPYPPRFRHPGRQPNWYRSLIESLFFNEMHNRRRRYFGIKHNR